MSKTKTDTPAIEVGKPIKIEAATRADVAKQLQALRKQADGLNAQGGFIEYDGGEKFSAVITFVKP
jgi:hypothetical protein